jgi:glutamate synthase domain-containing protein 1/glutamate synthase domain-containing protein 3
MDALERADALTAARASLRPEGQWLLPSPEAEGGCGVTGFACTIPVGGRHIYEPSIQMRNRGNGKGGGVAACGLVPQDMGVSRKVLEEDYILQVALLDPKARGEIEAKHVLPWFEIDQGGVVPTVKDYRDVPLLEIRPPDVARYFVRVKDSVLDRFATEKGLTKLPYRELADEFVFQNSIQLNKSFYASLGEKRGFVVSHARNLIIMKAVAFAEAAVEYYCMAGTRAHVWIAHQRYPTRGRVWHPGGAHPFIGMNEALVHNGDFANYHSVCEYLSQRNLFTQFLTDTEVSVLLFDLLSRTYGYPLEYIIEALAPTTELDFDRLSDEKRRIYRQIQAAHMHASPDGPWFFIIARSLAEQKTFQLLGITDTAMLRPQVFALQEGQVSIALVCSEKQAIDATLASLAKEDSRFTPVADQYWNARGGSSSDGGAFLMTVSPVNGGPTGDGAPDSSQYELGVTNKFGQPVKTAPGQVPCDLSTRVAPATHNNGDIAAIDQAIATQSAQAFFEYVRDEMPRMGYDRLRWFVDQAAGRLAEAAPGLGIEALTLCMDRRYDTGDKKRSSIYTILRGGLERIFAAQPLCDATPNGHAFCRVSWDSRMSLRPPVGQEKTLLIDARGFAAEGRDCDATLAIKAYELGWRRLVHYNTRGTRFHGAGFGPGTASLRLDCYDNPGDYLGSGMDGLQIHVHGNAQDQLCQIAKGGKAVIHGDVGQTLLYGAKGGDFYILGNAAGRPMINAVGRPRVVINGTALDYLAESFMAGDPLAGGGFAIVNGIRLDGSGQVAPLDMPYPGSNLLSLASGGAVYVRDPRHTLVDEQLNGGVYRPLSSADWSIIQPCLQENERLFGIRIQEDLLNVDGAPKSYAEVYRKVMPRDAAEHQARMEDEEATGD